MKKPKWRIGVYDKDNNNLSICQLKIVSLIDLNTFKQIKMSDLIEDIEKILVERGVINDKI